VEDLFKASNKVKVGVMGSAAEPVPSEGVDSLHIKAKALGQAIADHEVICLTGATTGVVYLVGKSAREGGALHIGISPASNAQEHRDHYHLPTDSTDVLIFTGFGLKGRNVVLVRSCDIVLFIAGAMGSLNEFTIAHDERKIIGCLLGTGGVADEADYLLEKFSQRKGVQIFRDEDAEKLIVDCLLAYSQTERR
jgi:uncharacterized protein (TIGR00725 family)